MRFTANLFLALALVLASAPSGAQVPAKARYSQSDGERLSISLRQGMTADQVENLMGKPKRTALRASMGAGAASEGAQSSLLWTYSWAGASYNERNLLIVFVGKSPDQWTVSSWDWTGY
jgi:hypothetical protein